jgi:hypothetical protein
MGQRLGWTPGKCDHLSTWDDPSEKTCDIQLDRMPQREVRPLIELSLNRNHDIRIVMPQNNRAKGHAKIKVAIAINIPGIGSMNALKVSIGDHTVRGWVRTVSIVPWSDETLCPMSIGFRNCET